VSNNPSVPQSTLFSWFNNFDEGQQQWLLDLARRHRDKINESHQQEAWERMQRFKELWPQGEGPGALPQWREYSVDYWQRSVLFLDLMRQHGNNFIRHEQAGCPPVLAYDYELIVDGSELPRPANYALVRIVPPEGTPQREDGRPYIIIDPRAGHGSGIGGFKNESEVGVALLHGHPVYFVIFYQHPMPDQTLADVCAAEAEFARTVQRRHPQAPHPIVIGNCQGGWAAMLLAAANPDLTGPVVVNGAPLSYWSGEVGKNAMRYLGGLYGGILPALMLSDLGDGEFDGANLVLNFEMLNPGNTWWRKYYDMFAHVDSEAPRYLDFERWWSGFFFMNEAEIGWILDNLFIGNKLARGQANLDERTHIDLRNIRSPIIVFASHGDNITPPQQALGWITDNYATEAEIKSRAQRILYTLHDHIGHLGIFVSSKVAKKQHQEIVSTLKTIEALPPGLYEIVITRVEGDGVDKRYTVEFEERALADIAALSGDREHEEAFATVARMSALGAEIYDLTWRPLIKASVNNATARACVRLNPLRQRRYAFSDRNPMMAAVPTMADKVREARKPVSADNPFLQWERLWADSVAQTWDWCRDVRDAWYELCFYQMFGSPMARALGESLQWRISDAPQEDLRALTDVQSALDRMEEGGFAAAVIRMLILLAKSRGSVRRSRLERSNEMLSSTEPFASMRLKKRTRLIHRQSLIVDFEPEQALETLANLIADPDERRRALEICEHVAGPAEDMTPTTVAMLERFKALFKISDEPSIKSAMPTQTAA
jgi:pimeloyl-ACP methyl ester carboxylesterase